MDCCLTSNLNYKTVIVLHSPDPSFIFPFIYYLLRCTLYQIFLLFLFWLPCHFYLVAIKQQPQLANCLEPLVSIDDLNKAFRYVENLFIHGFLFINPRFSIYSSKVCFYCTGLAIGCTITTNLG